MADYLVLKQKELVTLKLESVTPEDFDGSAKFLNFNGPAKYWGIEMEATIKGDQVYTNTFEGVEKKSVRVEFSDYKIFVKYLNLAKTSLEKISKAKIRDLFKKETPGIYFLKLGKHVLIDGQPFENDEQLNGGTKKVKVLVQPGFWVKGDVGGIFLKAVKIDFPFIDDEAIEDDEENDMGIKVVHTGNKR